jgi:hypothetical protein
VIGDWDFGGSEIISVVLFAGEVIESNSSFSVSKRVGLSADTLFDEFFFNFCSTGSPADKDKEVMAMVSFAANFDGVVVAAAALLFLFLAI